jgi:hypothetical protein
VVPPAASECPDVSDRLTVAAIPDVRLTEPSRAKWPSTKERCGLKRSAPEVGVGWRGARGTVAGCSGHGRADTDEDLTRSLERAHLVPAAVFDDEHSLTFAHGGDRLADQPGDGRLVRRAVADDQCPTTLGQPFDHLLQH